MASSRRASALETVLTRLPLDLSRAMKRKTIAHYEILRRLGAGGSGVVYAANDTLLQRPVVLKMLHTGLLTAEQMRSTVLREARLASAIEHPNVCAIYEVGESGDEALHRHAVCARPVAGPADRPRPGEPAAGALGGHSDRRRTAGRARAGHLSSRPETAERDADRRRPGQDSRLRPGAAARARRRRASIPPSRHWPRTPPSRPPTPRAAAPSATWRPSSSSPASPACSRTCGRWA